MDNLDYFGNSINTLTETLSGIELGEGVNFMREFPGCIKNNPLTEPTVTYGIKRLHSFYDLNLSEAMLLDITLGFTIHAPITSSGESCHELFTEIIGYLCQNVTLMTEFECGELKYNRSTGAIELDGSSTIRFFQT